MTSTIFPVIIAAIPRTGVRAIGAEDLIEAQVTAARIACKRMTGPALKLLLDSADRACGLPTRPDWERKAAAHAGFYQLLADAAGGVDAAGQPGGTASLYRDLMLAVGPVANGMITSSHRRLLAHLRARDAGAAALETEDHLRTLQFMWRMAGRPVRSTQGLPSPAADHDDQVMPADPAGLESSAPGS